jgi:hypothetical protein
MSGPYALQPLLHDRPHLPGALVVEVGNWVGWDNAHDVVYAGRSRHRRRPRWHSVYEMACNVITIFIGGKRSTPSRKAAPPSASGIAANTGMVSEAETEELIEALVHQHEPAYIEKISALLLAGNRRGGSSTSFSWPQPRWCSRPTAPAISRCRSTHEYRQHAGWFFDNFAHPQRLKLLYVAGSMVNQAAWNQQSAAG